MDQAARIAELERLLHMRRNVGDAEYERQVEAVLNRRSPITGLPRWLVVPRPQNGPTFIFTVVGHVKNCKVTFICTDETAAKAVELVMNSQARIWELEIEQE